jgi:hypothetical protein
MATPEFRGTGLQFKNGFDDQGRPPHLQRIPVGATATVALWNAGNLKIEHEISPQSKGVIAIRENPSEKSAMIRHIYITGLREDDTTIFVKPSPTTMAELSISVWNVKPVSVAFKFLQDTATPTPHRSRRPKNHVDKLLKIVNQIYYFQTAIRFVKKSVGDAILKGNWDSYILVPKEIDPAYNQFYLKMLSLCDHRADYNIFFAWSVESADHKLDKHKKDIDTEGINLQNLCLMDDVIAPTYLPVFTGDITPHGHCLAHEAGHFFGVGHRNDSSHNLMNEKLVPGGYISYGDARTMRDTVSKLSLPRKEDQKG